MCCLEFRAAFLLTIHNTKVFDTVRLQLGTFVVMPLSRVCLSTISCLIKSEKAQTHDGQVKTQ